MVERWWAEAERNQVLPLDNRVLWTLVHPKPDRRPARERFRYFAGGSQVPPTVAANIRNRSHALTVEATVPAGVVPAGVLLAQGSALGGWSLHVLGGHLRYVHNLYGKERHLIDSTTAVSPGSHVFSFSFDKDEDLGGNAVLRIDGQVVGEGTIGRFTPQAFNGVGVGLTCGYEWGPAVGDGYEAPFPFNGTIGRAFVDVTGPVVRDPLAELSAILSEQ